MMYFFIDRIKTKIYALVKPIRKMGNADLAEKVYDNNKMKVFAGFLSGLDIENIPNISFYGMSEQDQKAMQVHVAT